MSESMTDTNHVAPESTTVCCGEIRRHYYCDECGVCLIDRHPKTKHIVALSGGKDSTAMALRLKELNPSFDYTYVCTPTGDEPDEMFAHWNHLGEILGKRIVPVVHPLGLNGLIEYQNALPNWRQRWCTRILKIEPFRVWLANNAPAVSYVGLRADEEGRAGGAYDDLTGIQMKFPFREWGWGIGEVTQYLKDKEITIPERTDCNRCFYQRIHEWYLLWLNNRVVYDHAIGQEKKTGFTFRSPGRDTWPAALEDLAKEFEAGRIPKQRDGSALKVLQCRSCSL